jgi:hypothetical protein
MGRRGSGIVAVLLVCFLPGAAPAQEDRLANWAAPPYWMPRAGTPDGEPGEAPPRESLSARTALAPPAAAALPFFPLPPCRLVDTRGNAPLSGGFLPAATVRSYTLTGVCGLPANAQAVSLNAAVVKPVGPGFLTLYPQGGAFPPVSTLNYLGNDVIVNAAVVPLSVAGGISMALGVSGGDVVLDTNGYYAVAPGVSSLNALSGDLTLAPGANVTITPGGSVLTIAAAVNASSIATGVLAVAQGGTGAATPSASAYQARVSGTCAGGSISSIAADGSVTCTADPVTSTSFGGNVMTTVDSTADVGNQNAITIGGDGLPFVAYYDATNLALKTLKCGNASCTSGNVIRFVPGPAGASVSTAAGLDGFPVFSFFDAVNKGLRFGKCGDPTCASPFVTTIAAGSAGNVVGLDNSIFVPADGRPVVSFYMLTLARLGAVRCGNPSCSAGNFSPGFGFTADFGSFSSIAAGGDGLATISHFDGQNGRLAVTHCTTLGCGGYTNRAPDVGPGVGQETSLAIGVDGLAVVSYRDYTNGWLKILKCGNLACDVGNTVTPVDTASPTGFSTSIAIAASGFPVVSYTGGSPAALKVLACGNAACSSGNVISTPDATSSFVATSITIAPDGLPVVSYYDQTNHRLRVLKCGSPTCAAGVRRR